MIRYLGADPSTAVEHLTIGYRVPAPILDVANRLLPATGVDVPASRSVRQEGHAPGGPPRGRSRLGAAEEVVALRRHHALTGVIAPERWLTPIADALATVGLTAVGHVQGLAANEVPVFGYELVKGLELDGVVVVSPERGARRHRAGRPPRLRRADPGGAGADDRDALDALPQVLGLGSSGHDQRDIAPVC